MSIDQELQSQDPQRRKQALQNIAQEPATAELVSTLEQLAAHDPYIEIRAAALDALDTPKIRTLRAQRLMKLTGSEQRFILQELDSWQKQGLIGDDLARALRSRYRVVIKPGPAPAAQAGTPASPAPASVSKTDSIPVQPVSPPAPRAPRPSLAQTLLSETSIKTFLYLGAFFVISAAIILAALVETLRLPILSLASLGFGGTALALKKRLPQPSFVLFIVFSFILPINAGVFADLIGLEDQLLAAYWTFVLLASAAIWIFAAWFYNSRFFSLTALGAFVCAAWFIPSIISIDPLGEARLLTSQLANLIGLGGIIILTRRKSRAFAMPTFLLGQLISVLIVAGLLGTALINFFQFYFDNNATSGVWLALSAGWLVTSLYYAASNTLISFALFPWFSTIALVPVIFLAQHEFELSRQDWALALGWTIWAAGLTLLSEISYRIGQLQRLKGKTMPYSLPLALAGIALFLLGGLWGLVVSFAWGFALFLPAAILLGLAHLIRPRGWVWLAALLSGLSAYFIFFNLPFLPDLEMYPLYQVTPAVILLLLPDLLLRPDWNKNPAWFYPLRGLGLVLSGWALLVLLVTGIEDPTQAAICAILLAGFSLLYALRYQKPIIGYIPGALFAMGLAYGLNSFDFQFTFSALSILATLYYASGWFLLRFMRSTGWSNTGRRSALVLSLVLVASALILENRFEGWFIGIFAILFMAETRHHPRIESVAAALFGLGYSLVLFENKVEPLFFHLAGVSMLWLAVNYAYAKTLTTRQLAPLTQTGAILLTGATAVFLAGETDPSVPFFWMGLTLSGFMLAYALLQRQAQLGYAFTLFLALSTLSMSRIWFDADWLWALTPLAIVYFALGLALKNNWGSTFRFSGLGLSALTALSAPFAGQVGAGWFVAVLSLTWLIDTWRNKRPWAEAGFYLSGLLAFGLILEQYNLLTFSYFFFGMSIFLLGSDLIFGFGIQRSPVLALPVRLLGGLAAGIALLAGLEGGIRAGDVLVAFALTVFFGLYAPLRRQPLLGYAPAGLLAVSILFLLNWQGWDFWLWAMIALAVAYYLVSLALGLFSADWSRVLRFSGVGLGTLTSFGALAQGPSVAASIPIALAASLWAVEAFRRRNVWLGFPTNILYLMSYFMLLVSLEVNQAQFYSVGAALLGLLMHYLLTRAGSDKGAFVTGLVSQLVLLGTTYIQMVATEELGYFAALFFQALVVLVYGLVLRSRSLVGVPIAMLVLGVTTIVLFILRGLSTVILIGCTGIVMILVATLAVVLRERLAQVGERLSGWRA